MHEKIASQESGPSLSDLLNDALAIVQRSCRKLKVVSVFITWRLGLKRGWNVSFRSYPDRLDMAFDMVRLGGLALLRPAGVCADTVSALSAWPFVIFIGSCFGKRRSQVQGFIPMATRWSYLHGEAQTGTSCSRLWICLSCCLSQWLLKLCWVLCFCCMKKKMQFNRHLDQMERN